MQYFNNGMLHLQSEGQIGHEVIECFARHGLSGVCIDFDDKTVEFSEYPGDIEEGLKESIAELHRLGYRFSGIVSYYGDYDGGYIACDDGSVVVLDETDFVLRMANDEELKKEMERRGYIVTAKIGTATEEQEE